METVEQIQSYFGVDLNQIIDKPVKINFPGEEEGQDAIFLGLEIDRDYFIYCCVRRPNSFMVEGVHPSRVRLE